MNVEFKFSRVGEFGLLVEGLESDLGQYVEYEDHEIRTNAFSWKDSVSVDVLHISNSKGETTYITHSIDDHSATCCYDKSLFQLERDGLYEVTRFIIPNETWFNKVSGSSDYDTFDPIYYYKEGKLYKDSEGISEEITIHDLIEAEGLFKKTKQTFILYHLMKCFANLLKNLLNNLPNRDCTPAQLDAICKMEKDRDYIWMFINVIRYSIERQQLYEAQRFLERFVKCGVICAEYVTPLKLKGCGCK